MKKNLTILTIALGLAAAANAQDTMKAEKPVPDKMADAKMPAKKKTKGAKKSGKMMDDKMKSEPMMDKTTDEKMKSEKMMDKTAGDKIKP